MLFYLLENEQSGLYNNTNFIHVYVHTSYTYDIFIQRLLASLFYAFDTKRLGSHSMSGMFILYD